MKNNSKINNFLDVLTTRIINFFYSNEKYPLVEEYSENKSFGKVYYIDFKYKTLIDDGRK
jgi:hypothetical protein